MPLQWRNQIWQSLEEGAGKRCLECGYRYDVSRKTSDSTTRDCCPSLSEVIESGEETVIWGERVVVIKGSATREVIPSTLTATR